MATTSKDAKQRRERLLAARADCLARMSDQARSAFERQGTRRPYPQKDRAAPVEAPAEGHGMVAQEVKTLIAEAHRLRGRAEQGRDIRTAMKGLDTALKALQLYGRATGEIREQRSASVTVNVVATREEGIQAAAELLLELASPAELGLLISQLRQRLAELQTSGVLKTALPPVVEQAQPESLATPAFGEKEENEIG